MPHTHGMKKILNETFYYTCILTEIHLEVRCKFSTSGTMPGLKYFGLWTMWSSELWMITLNLC